MGMLQIGLLLASIVTLIFVIYKVKKNKMDIHYSIIWIVWGALLIIIALFPQIIIYISNLLSIATPSNTAFLIMIFLLYCLTFYVYLKISKHNDEIAKLNYEISSLKKQVNDNKNK